MRNAVHLTIRSQDTAPPFISITLNPVIFVVSAVLETGSMIRTDVLFEGTP